jgi:Domain of Unknown Function (DUF928)
MKFQKSNLPVFLVQLTSFCLAVGTIAFSPEVWAQLGPNNESTIESSNPSASSQTLSIDRYLRWEQLFEVTKLFEGDGQTRDENSTAAASRGRCPMLPAQLTALIPITNEGRTVDGHPTFWFYVSYDTNVVNRATFILLDAEQNYVLPEPISIPLSGTPGLVSVTLPASTKELEVDQKYHWFFELECDAENPSDNYRIDGWVQRVAPIPGIEPDDYIAYAEHGIWYNALTPLARMRQQDGQNATLQNDWEDLLKAVQLEYLTDVSIADCCKEVESANGI